MFDLARFGLSDTFEVSAAVPELAEGAGTIRETAKRLARYFSEQVVDKKTGERSLALVQCFLGCPFADLPTDLQAIAATASPASSALPRQVCLTLLTSVGDGAGGSDPRVRNASTVLVPSAAADVLAPLAAHITEQLRRCDDPGGALLRADVGYAIGYVPDAGQSAVLGDISDLVVTYGIASALSITARFGSQRSVTMVLYSKTRIPERTADAFAPVAMGLKLALIEYVAFGVPDLGGRPITSDGNVDSLDWREVLREQNAALRELLHLRHEIALGESSQLEQALELAERRAEELAESESALAGSQARASAIVRASLDAVVVMDANGRIVEWNPSAERIFGYSSEEAVGEDLGDLIVPDELRSRHHRGLEQYQETGRGPLLGRRVEITALRHDGTTFPVELTITAVTGGGRQLFTGFIRDVTERRAEQAALVESRESFAQIARALQQSLLPAALPTVPGVEVAAVFHPSRAGSDVGGDFYDVFRVGRTDLILSLGDVCGKGPEAAAITAIARHTIRAVAEDLRHPTAILRRVNTVLQDHHIGERFCSAVTARAIPIVRGLRLSVCCAGHDPPVIVRADGQVHRVGVPGQLLGILPEIRLYEETAQLAYGDTVVLYTDGVTEAMHAGEQFGEDRLAGALLESRHGSVSDMMNHVLEEVLAFGGDGPRDDIAILAIRAVGPG